MNRDEIKKIVAEILIENGRNFSPKSERDLVWYSLRGIISTWIYMLGPAPLASVWWSGNRWHYSIPILDKIGGEKCREDAMARAEIHLAEVARRLHSGEINNGD